MSLGFIALTVMMLHIEHNAVTCDQMFLLHNFEKNITHFCLSQKENLNTLGKLSLTASVSEKTDDDNNSIPCFFASSLGTQVLLIRQ